MDTEEPRKVGADTTSSVSERPIEPLMFIHPNDIPTEFAKSGRERIKIPHEDFIAAMFKDPKDKAMALSYTASQIAAEERRKKAFDRIKKL